MQPELPLRFAFEPGLAQSYDESGWCFVEAAISAGVKIGKRRLNLSKRTDHLLAYSGYLDAFRNLEDVCAAARLPPLLPDEVRRLLGTEKKFTSSTDLDRVDQLYRTFFDGVTLAATELNMQGLGWTVTEVQQLITVLPCFTALTSLDLSNNKLGEEGGVAVAGGVLRAMTSVTECNFRGNRLNEESVKEIAKIGTEKRIMLFGIKHGQAEADLSSQGLGSVDAILIANDLAVTTSMTKISLAGNCLGEEGTKSICEAVKASTMLKDLDLGGRSDFGTTTSNIDGAAGARHVADMLLVTTSLTSVRALRNS